MHHSEHRYSLDYPWSAKKNACSEVLWLFFGSMKNPGRSGSVSYFMGFDMASGTLKANTNNVIPIKAPTVVCLRNIISVHN